MANVVAPQAIAHAALTQTMGEAEQAAVLLELMTDLVTRGQTAQETHNLRELTIFEREPQRIGRLVDLLTQGNYLEVAARLSGIASSSVRSWVAAAEKGDERYTAVVNLIRIGEAIAESSSVSDVRAAGKDPPFWAAAMTYLERRYPDRWGRRSEEADGPRVVVQIGVKDSDVRVSIASPERPTLITGADLDPTDPISRS